jgi:hypothetical protein
MVAALQHVVVTSQPAGIDCIITRGNGSGTCDEFFPVGTVVRLDARPAADSSFVGGRRSLPGCADASKVTIARGTTIVCQPGSSSARTGAVRGGILVALGLAMPAAAPGCRRS